MTVTKTGSLLRVFVNGVLDTQATLPGVTSAANAQVLLCAATLEVLPAWNPDRCGALDDVRVFNRALTSTEITALSDVGSLTGAGPVAGLVARWSLDEVSGSSVADSSAFRNHGVVNGAVVRSVDPPTVRANGLTASSGGGLTVATTATPVALGDRAAVAVTSNASSAVLTVGVVVAPKAVGVTATRFYRSGSALVAVRTGGTGAVTDGLSWVVTDRQGTITATVPAGSTTGSVNRYRPFGVNRAGDAITATARGFLARGEDPDGLVATDHRLYDPTIGRFLTIDPLLDQTRDPYGYGAGNPATMSDPSGLAPLDEFGLPPGFACWVCAPGADFGSYPMEGFSGRDGGVGSCFLVRCGDPNDGSRYRSAYTYTRTGLLSAGALDAPWQRRARVQQEMARMLAPPSVGSDLSVGDVVEGVMNALDAGATVLEAVPGAVTGASLELVKVTSVAVTAVQVSDAVLDQWDRDDGYDAWTRVARAALAGGMSAGTNLLSGAAARSIISSGCAATALAGCAAFIVLGLAAWKVVNVSGEFVREGVLGE